VAIRAVLETQHGGVFGPDDITAIAAAFEPTLQALGLTNVTTDPAVMMIAKLIIDIAKQGERDPKRLSETVLKLVSK